MSGPPRGTCQFGTEEWVEQDINGAWPMLSLSMTKVPGSAGEGWAIGTAQNESQSCFIHISDYGRTWEVTQVVETPARNIGWIVDCVEGGHCWANIGDERLSTSMLWALHPPSG